MNRPVAFKSFGAGLLMTGLASLFIASAAIRATYNGSRALDEHDRMSNNQLTALVGGVGGISAAGVGVFLLTMGFSVSRRLVE